MNYQTKTHERKIDKQHLRNMTSYILRHIPKTDEATINNFLELLHTSGRSGWITVEQLIQQREVMRRYVPGTCAHSLDVLFELLDVPTSADGDQDADFLAHEPSSAKLEESISHMTAYQNGRSVNDGQECMVSRNGHRR